jgi:hypothetical protein
MLAQRYASIAAAPPRRSEDVRFFRDGTGN